MVPWYCPSSVSMTARRWRGTTLRRLRERHRPRWLSLARRLAPAPGEPFWHLPQSQPTTRALRRPGHKLVPPGLSDGTRRRRERQLRRRRAIVRCPSCHTNVRDPRRLAARGAVLDSSSYVNGPLQRKCNRCAPRDWRGNQLRAISSIPKATSNSALTCFPTASVRHTTASSRLFRSRDAIAVRRGDELSTCCVAHRLLRVDPKPAPANVEEN